jgi:hypothetical protein
MVSVNMYSLTESDVDNVYIHNNFPVKFLRAFR